MARFLSVLLKFLITLPVIAFLFFVTLSNRDQAINLIWSPLSDPLRLSIPIALFAALVIGFIWGALILWSNTLTLRAERRAFKKEVSVLEKRIAVQSAEYERRLSQRNHVIESAPAPRIAPPDIL